MSIGDNGTILTSSDGTTWTSRWFDTTYDFYGGTYGNSEFAVVGESGKVLISTNGTSFYTQTLTSFTTTTYGIAYGGSTWVLVGVSGNIYTIADFSETDVTSRISGTTEHLWRVFYKE